MIVLWVTLNMTSPRDRGESRESEGEREGENNNRMRGGQWASAVAPGQNGLRVATASYNPE